MIIDQTGSTNAVRYYKYIHTPTTCSRTLHTSTLIKPNMTFKCPYCNVIDKNFSGQGFEYYYKYYKFTQASCNHMTDEGQCGSVVMRSTTDHAQNLSILYSYTNNKVIEEIADIEIPLVININVEKKWNDDGNAYDTRPTNGIVAKLYRSTDQINWTKQATLTLNNSNSFKGSFNNLLIYNNSGLGYYYKVEEDKPDNYYKDPLYSIDNENNYVSDSIVINAENIMKNNSNCTTTIFVKNILEDINISGLVWLDGQTGIKPARAADGYYDKNNVNDKVMASIKVYLYKVLYDDNGNKIGTEAVKLETNNNGEKIGYGDGYVVTDNLGMYTFNNIEIGEYYVKFEYDGINYKDTIRNPIGNLPLPKSLASENENIRTEFNNKFKNIRLNSAYSLTTATEGIALDYKSDTDSSGYKTSTLITMEKRNVGTTVEHTVVQDKFAMQSQTETTIYKEITRDINCGLVKKGVDLSLISNLENAEVKINGKTTEYEYDPNDNTLTVNANTIINNNNTDISSPKLKKVPDYRLDLYNSDYEFQATSATPLQTEPDELEIYLTYRIGIINASANVAYINDIGNYHNDKMEFVSAKYVDPKNSDNNKNITDISVNQIEECITINEKVLANEIKYLVLRFKLTENIENAEKINLGEYQNISEILSYSTEDGGLVDCDSEPGNMNRQAVESDPHEDDETITGKLNITIKIIDNKIIQRNLTGFVWDDSQEDSKGEYNGENKVSGVKVQLIEIKNGKEDIWQETISGGDTVTYKKEDGTYATYNVDNELGEYTFNNFIPGDYIVRFIYGNGTTTDIKDINGNDMTVATPNVDVQDYKSTTDKRYNQGWYNKVDNQIVESAYKETDEDKNKIFNVARDNEKTRLASMVKTIEVSRSQYDPDDVSTQTPNAEGNYNYSLKQISEAMDASTSKIYVAVDSELLKNIEGNNLIKVDGISDTKYIKEYNNINFGIEERPKTKLTIEKHLTSLKITANNGTTITDAYIDLDGELKGIRDGLSKLVSTRDDRGVWKLETDIEEVIQGAKLEAVYTYTITNNSETDYLSKTLVNAYNNYYKPDRAPKTKKYTDVLRDANPTYIGEYLGSTYYTGIKTDDVTEVPSTALRLNDYINNELTYVKSNVFYKIDEDSEKYKIHDVEGNSIETVIKTVLSSDTSTETLNPGSSVNYDSVTVKKDNLSSTGNLTFYSYIAQIESYTNAAGRVDPDSVPGNLEDRFVHTLNPYDKIENDEFWGERIEIGKPTGEDNSINYKLIIAIVAGIGIIGIGAFATKKHIIK